MASLNGSGIVMIVLIVAGGLAGSAIADVAGGYIPFLKNTVRIGFDPFIMDLHFMALTLGFKMSFSIFTAIGLIGGYWVYKKI